MQETIKTLYEVLNSQFSVKIYNNYIEDLEDLFIIKVKDKDTLQISFSREIHPDSIVWIITCITPYNIEFNSCFYRAKDGVIYYNEDADQKWENEKAERYIQLFKQIEAANNILENLEYYDVPVC